MNHSTFSRILAALVLVAVLLAAFPAPAAARAAQVYVSGAGDLFNGPTGGETRPDGAGNFHFRDRVYSGAIALAGDGVAIQGTQTLVLMGYADPNGSGPFSGTYTISAGGKVLFSGRIYGFTEFGLSYARVVTEGQGAFAKTQLKLNVIEDAPTENNPDPQTFGLEGQILYK